MKKIRGNIILGTGLLIFSVTLLLQNTIIYNEVISSIFCGIAIGLEILGLVKQCKENVFE